MTKGHSTEDCRAEKFQINVLQLESQMISLASALWQTQNR